MSMCVFSVCVWGRGGGRFEECVCMHVCGICVSQCLHTCVHVRQY